MTHSAFLCSLRADDCDREQVLHESQFEICPQLVFVCEEGLIGPRHTAACLEYEDEDCEGFLDSCWHGLVFEGRRC